MNVSKICSTALCTVLFASFLSSQAQAAPAPFSAPLPAALFAQPEIFTPMSSQPSQGGPLCGPVCFGPTHTTATLSGSGSTCTGATSSLSSQLHSIAVAFCQNDAIGVCNNTVTVNITVACTLIAPGTYKVQGYGTYRCFDTTC